MYRELFRQLVCSQKFVSFHTVDKKQVLYLLRLGPIYKNVLKITFVVVIS